MPKYFYTAFLGGYSLLACSDRIIRRPMPVRGVMHMRPTWRVSIPWVNNLTQHASTL